MIRKRSQRRKSFYTEGAESTEFTEKSGQDFSA